MNYMLRVRYMNEQESTIPNKHLTQYIHKKQDLTNTPVTTTIYTTNITTCIRLIPQADSTRYQPIVISLCDYSSQIHEMRRET